MPRAKPLLIVVAVVVLAPVASVSLFVTATETPPPPVSQTDADWDYEPRVWTPDELEPIGLEDDSSGQNHQETTINNDELRATINTNNLNDQDVRRKNHFWQSKWIPKGKQKAQVNSGEEKCDQFRVDIRETVICDKKRCDKLDFEWPIHSNQLVLIQTTKYGMRFHRGDFAFGTNQNQRQSTINTALNIESNLRPITNSRVKFDIFELFKPKPSPSPMPTNVTTPPTTSTMTSTPSTMSTSAAPFGQPNNNTDNMPINNNNNNSNSQAADENIYRQDGNSTRLVTTFRVDTKRRMQKIIGFGGALTDSTCRNIKSLSPEMAKSLMEDYYGPRGLRYNIARVTIGSSDFSTTPYTNNDRSEQSSIRRQAFDENDDVEMRKFRLTEEDYQYKLPVARQAIATSQQELKFFSSLWSPPIWMKNNSHIVHGYLKGDVYGPYYKALGELIVKWHEAYRRNGIEFWATTGLNEPVTGIKPFIFHNSLGITREDYVTFMKLYLGPMLRQRGFHNMKLIGLDDNKGYVPQLAMSLLADREASKYISGIAVHWYMNDEYDNLNELINQHPDKFIISTEACNGYLPFQVHTLPGDWDRGVAYIYDIIKLMQKNVAGWVDWNMVLDLYGGPSWAKNNLDAAVIVNAEKDEYYKSPMFYALGHFSRFVEPNSYRLDHRLTNAKYDYPLEAVAFITPKDYVVIVVLNANRYPIPFKVIVDKQVVQVVKLREESFTTIILKSWNKS